MKAVILAGGQGTRLGILTKSIPKPLIPIAGPPCIDYVLKSLAPANFDDIIITTGYMAHKLVDHVGDGSKYNASFQFAIEETPAGTAGAVRNVKENLDDTFVVASGDVFAEVDFRSIFEFHRSKKAAATMALTKVENPTEFGIVGLNEDNRIVKFKEKPKEAEIFSNLINAGIYVLEPEVIDFVPEEGMFDFSKNLFPLLLEKGFPLYGIPIPGLWMDIGRPSDVLKASLEVIERNGKKVDIAGVSVSGKGMIGTRNIFGDSIELKGPCYIGSEVEIGDDVSIKRSCIYDGVKISAGTSIKDSVIFHSGVLGNNTEVLESIVSRNCELEEDVRVINSIIGDGESIKSGATIKNEGLP